MVPTARVFFCFLILMLIILPSLAMDESSGGPRMPEFKGLRSQFSMWMMNFLAFLVAKHAALVPLFEFTSLEPEPNVGDFLGCTNTRRFIQGSQGDFW